MTDNPWLIFIEAEVAASKSKLPNQLRKMYRKYRFTKDKKCGDCAHLYLHSHNDKRYYKCEIYGETCGLGTDWCKKWDACGIWKAKDDTK